MKKTFRYSLPEINFLECLSFVLLTCFDVIAIIFPRKESLQTISER